MEIQPSLDEFTRLGAQRRVVSIWTKLSADDLTAVGLYQQLCGRRDGTFLLESAEQGVWSRWSFVGVNCPTALAGSGNESQWLGRQIDGLPSSGEPLAVLHQTMALLASEPQPGLPPFTSGLVGYLGYDMIRHVEQLPHTNPDDAGIPELLFLLTSDLAVLDHHRGEVWLIANAINFDGSPERIEIAYADACARVQHMTELVGRPRGALTQPIGDELADAEQISVQRQTTPERFQEMVTKAQQRIVAGDIFQVVPSQRFDIETDCDALAIYRQLRSGNPSPYLFLLRLNDGQRSFAVVGSSPEALVTVKDGLATTHPIAGTRPRGADAAADAALERELLADEKERAEHLMLVDLGRNDLGRVCVPGSVQVTEFMNVHRYSTVMHLEATVQGQVRPEFSALDVTMACFPAGTLSGAPKVMAMRIIDELEDVRRGVYGGVVGYFDFAGNCDMAIAIRTALLIDGVARVQAGAGIVADSVPASEEAETRNKAASVINAIRRADAIERAKRSAKPTTVLDGIIAGVRADMAVDMTKIPISELQRVVAELPPALDPRPAFRGPELSVIAEVKRSSPSAGALAEISDPAELAAQYAQGGAAAISVLTEQRRFHGSLEDLRKVRSRVDIPLLRKDFIVDEYQVWQARAAGADLVLLIVAALDDPRLRGLYDLITQLGMTALVEVHDEAEAERAVRLGAEVIGVNNRNLKTLAVDPEQFGRIVPLLPDHVIKVAESGIRDGQDAAKFAALGADVVLVGQALVTTASPAQAVREMIEMARPVRKKMP